jgi:rhodanese-related sulfurtransferase
MPRTHHPSSSARRTAARPNLAGLWIAVGLAVVAIAGYFLLQQPAAATPTQISVAQAYGKFQAGAFFLDVRTKSEWDQLHLSRSTLIPLDELSARLSEVPRDQDVVVICRSGARSKEGMTILRSAGYTRVVCMTGGLLAWQAAGYPLEAGHQ